MTYEDYLDHGRRLSGAPKAPQREQEPPTLGPHDFDPEIGMTAAQYNGTEELPPESPTLADVLAEHETWLRAGAWGQLWRCKCGAPVDDDPSGVNIGARHRAHLAAAIEQHHAAEKARVRDEALEEAARAVEAAGEMYGHVTSTKGSARVIRDIKSGDLT